MAPLDLINHPPGSGGTLTTQDVVPPVPVHVNRLTDYSQWEANHPGDPLPGDDVDADFDSTNDTINLVMDRLALIQRDDGALANGSVGPDQLDPAVFGELGETLQQAVDAAEAAATQAQTAATNAALSAQQAAAAADLIPTPVLPGDVGKVPMVAPTGDYELQSIGGGGDLVSSVFGRLGDVVAQAGDYGADKITYAHAGGIVNVLQALDQLYANKLDRTLGSVAAATGIIAAGNTAGTATVLTVDMNEVTTVAVGADGVRLPATVAGRRVVVSNWAASGLPLKIYPPAGNYIDDKGLDNPYILGPLQTAEFLASNDWSWRSNLGSMLSNSNPLPLNGVNPGVANAAARADHVHPAADLSTAAVVGRLPYSKLVQEAAITLLGNNTGGLADTAPLTVAQVIAMLGVYTSGQVDALLANYANVTQVTAFQKALRGAVVALSASAVTVPDMNAGNYFKATLDANYVVPNPVNAAVGQSGLFLLQQDATGGRVVTWGVNYKWPGGAAPNNTLTANAKDVIPYYVNGAAEILCGNITADIK